jgi:two-component system cell cycle sensor histidine kinase/response regulator CckA
VLTAASGQEAIDAYSETRDEIDLFIIDMIMPHMSGSELFDRLRKINPTVKVLLSSGYSIKGQAREIINRGCNGFIQKPFSISQLSVKIREILS